MADFDMHADTPAAPTDLAAGDLFAFDDISANAAAGGFDTLAADDLLRALTLVADAAGPISLVSGVLKFRPDSGAIISFRRGSDDAELMTWAGGSALINFGGFDTGLGADRASLSQHTLGWGASSTIVWWSGAGYGQGGPDLELVRPAANVLRVADGSTGIGKTLTAKLVEANTAGSGAPNVLTSAESRTVLTNEGATAQNYHTLPTAAAGLEFEFVVQDTDGIRVVAGADDTIQDVGTVSGAAGFIQSTTVGSALRLLAINAVQWVVMSKMGTWTIDA